MKWMADSAAIDDGLQQMPVAPAVKPTFWTHLRENWGKPLATDQTVEALRPWGERTVRNIGAEISSPGFLNSVRDNIAADFDRGVNVDNTTADRHALTDAYQTVLETVNRGRPRDQRLVNPMLLYDMPENPAMPVGAASPLSQTREEADADLWQAVAALKRDNPGAAANLPGSLAELREHMRAAQRAAVAHAETVAARSGPVARTVGMLTGGGGASLFDPVNLAAMGVGAPASASLLKTFLIEGAVNAGADAATLPERLHTYREIGLPDASGGGVAAELTGNFLMGGAFASGLKGLSRVAEKALSPQGTPADLVRAFDERFPDPGEDGRAARNFVAELAAREADNPYGPENLERFRQDMMRTAAAADLRVPASEPMDEAAAARLIRFADPDTAADASREQAATLAQEFARPTGAAEIPADDYAAALTGKTGADLDAAVVPALHEGHQVASLIDTTKMPDDEAAGVTVQKFDPDRIGTDAANMQYKGGGDAAGVTDRLAGVTRWDPAKAGLSLIWERRDGALIVADGHQRLALAKRSKAAGQDVPYYGILYREADGYSAADMRAIAAFKNIAEGSGTPADAAQILRDHPEGLSELPPRSPLVRTANDLAALGDDAYGMVRNGVASERDGAIVGHYVRDPAVQAEILRYLAKSSPATAEEAELFVRQALAAGAAKEVQTDMFGSFLHADLILPERVKILKSALTQLRRDKALFATLTRNESAIASAGNVLDTEANAARAAASTRAFVVLKALAERKGEISDALQAAAERAHRTGNRAAAVRDFVAAIRDAARKGNFDRLEAGDTVGAVEPAPAGRSLSGEQGRLPLDAGETDARTIQRNFLAGQDGRSLDELYASAPARQAELDDAGAAAAKAAGMEWIGGRIKKRATAEAKIGRKGYAGPGQLTDIVRGMLLADDPAAADRAVAVLNQHFDLLDQGWLTTAFGYIDRKLLVRFGDGSLGEIEIRPRQMHEAVKVGGHRQYEAWRALPADAPEKLRLEADMRTAYAAATARLPEAWRGVVSQSGTGGNVPKNLSKASFESTPAVMPTSEASTSTQGAPGDSTAAARWVSPQNSAGRKSQSQNLSSMGDTSEPIISDKKTLDKTGKEEFGAASEEIAALRALPQDAQVPAQPHLAMAGGAGPVTMKRVTLELEREARASAALERCLNGRTGSKKGTENGV